MSASSARTPILGFEMRNGYECGVDEKHDETALVV